MDREKGRKGEERVEGKEVGRGTGYEKSDEEKFIGRHN